MSEIWALLRQPRLSTTLAMAGVVVVGLSLMAVAYRGAAATLLVPFQVPFLVSGSLAGLAVVGSGLALLVVHLERVEAAEERRRLASLQRDALRLLAVVSQR